MKLLRAVAVFTGALVLLGVVPASAGDFTPTIKFELSDARVKANPQMKVSVSQDDGEEELAHVTLTIPKGFSLPDDAAIANDDQLGAGTINIDAGPGCRPDSPAPDANAPVSGIPATLKEKDRTEEQAQAGIYAVWFLDISGVTSVNLAITGSKKTGWTLDGDIPPNDNTCPPFSFELNVNSQSTTGGVPILVNPKKPGKKVFTATFTSLDSPTSITLKQPIKITK
jgi:hypothetical protein